MDDIKEKQEKQKYIEIINQFLLKNKNIYSIKDINNINIFFKNLGGGMNKNYLVEIVDNENNQTYKIFFRYFRAIITSIFDRNKEIEIQKKLGEEGYGPKILDFDYENKKYRIDEYLDDMRELLFEEYLNDEIINNLIIIINKYSKISDIYKYELIKENSKDIIKLEKTGNNQFNINKNIYDNIINNIYDRAIKNFEKFNNDYTKSTIRTQHLNDTNINKIKNIINKFQKLFISFFNDTGYFILNHHDLYQANILLNTNNKKLYIIDNELACLSFIGFDIVWYELMSLMKLFPKFEFYPNLMNYNKFYNIFKRYLECFIKTNSDWINQKQERIINYIEYIKKEKYFCELLCVENLFAFIIGLTDLQFEEEFVTKSIPPFFENVLFRLQLFEFSYEKYKFNN